MIELILIVGAFVLGVVVSQSHFVSEFAGPWSPYRGDTKSMDESAP